MRTLIVIHGGLNAETYWQFYEMDPSYFQDDNATCRVARARMVWYGDIEVQRLDCSAQSPDFKPVEPLWDELERGLNECH